MPIFLEKKLNDFTQMAVWKLTESADELLELLPVHLKEEGLRDEIPNILLFRQRLASRIMLARMLRVPQLELARDTDCKRTLLINPPRQLSISHAGEYAAVIISRNEKVGIDVEEVSERIARISSRFMNEQEFTYLASDNDYKTMMLLWAVKEAVFKYANIIGLDFKTISCAPFKMAGSGIIRVSLESGMPEVNYHILGNYVLAWVNDSLFNPA